MTEDSSETLHATCVALNGHAVLIEGRSGAGKSDLALRLIDRGAQLVSDDYTLVTRDDRQLRASPPARIAGKIEVRGIGILPMAHVTDVPVALMVTIDPSPERLPRCAEYRRVAGLDVAVIALASLEPSAALKVELALQHLDRLP